MISVHSCLRGRILVRLPEEWRLRCIHVWGVGNQCIYLRGDNFSAFMCWDRVLLHLPEGWWFRVHSCVRDRISVHLLEGWQFRCIHVWGVGYRCIYLKSDDLGCIHFLRGKIPVHLLQVWWFRCIHVWGVGYQCIYLRSDDFGSFMCEDWDSGASEGWLFRWIHVWGVGYPCIYLISNGFLCIRVWGVKFLCIYLRNDDFGIFLCDWNDIIASTWGVTISGAFMREG